MECLKSNGSLLFFPLIIRLMLILVSFFCFFSSRKKNVSWILNSVLNWYIWCKGASLPHKHSFFFSLGLCSVVLIECYFSIISWEPNEIDFTLLCAYCWDLHIMSILFFPVCLDFQLQLAFLCGFEISSHHQLINYCGQDLYIDLSLVGLQLAYLNCYCLVKGFLKLISRLLPIENLYVWVLNIIYANMVTLWSLSVILEFLPR